MINTASFTFNKEVQADTSPKAALDLLMEGNKRFTAGNRNEKDYQAQVKATSTGQYPIAAIVSCIDSRIPTEIVFDQSIGDIFNARIAGNFMNEDILGSLEFACKVAGSKVIMIMGHTSCGAVKGACDHVELGNLTQMLDKIQPAIARSKTDKEEDYSSANLDFVNRVSAENVRVAIEHIHANSPVLKEMLDNNEIDIVGSIYHVESGAVELI